MIPTALIAALVLGWFWSEDHRRLEAERDLARKQHRDAEARACANGLRYLLATVERDHARRLVHPSTRDLAPVRVHGSGASVTPIRKGER